MINCYDCERCGKDKHGNAVCTSEDGKSHIILEYKLYDSDGDFRRALFECGRECGKFVLRTKKKAEQCKALNVESMSLIQCAGWITATCIAGALVATYLLIAVGVL